MCDLKCLSFRIMVTASVGKDQLWMPSIQVSVQTFDTVPHSILADKLMKLWMNCWIRKRLNCRIQRVAVNSSMAKGKPVMSGVSQGSVTI